MSAVLVVTKDKKQVAKVPIIGDTFVIGRAPDCNLRLDESLASRRHAEVAREGRRYLIKDNGTTNGTTVNGEKITTRRELKDGDEIGIGGTRLKFVCDAGSDAGGEADEEATRPALPEDFAGKLPGLQVQAKKDQGSLEFKLRVVEGASQGAVFRNWDGPLTIGRALDNHVVLMDDNLVSSHHAQIVKKGEEFFLQDLESANGTFLDGVKAQREKLCNGQKVKIGKALLAFELVDKRVQRRKLKIVLISVTALVLIAALVKLLQPEDIAGKYIAQGLALTQRGEWAKAAEEFQKALVVEPNRLEAKQGLANVKAELEAQDLLASAEAAARAEQYDKAKGFIYRVLRDRPRNPRALEMEAVIKSIEDAQVAIRARNWTDAVRLLDKARSTYPKSDLISALFLQAQKELTAEQSLAKAKNALEHSQLDMAEGYLTNIPSASAYYPPARELLDKIVRERKTSAGAGRAQTFYREGRLTEALTELEAALQAAPNNATLVESRNRIRKMVELSGPLKAAEGLSQQATDSVKELLGARVTCNDVLNLEPDTLNAIRRRALEARDRLSAQLKSVSQKQAATATEMMNRAGQLADARAEELLQPAMRMRAEQLRKAWELMASAAKADESNQTAAQAADALEKQVVGACQKLYRRGIGLDELGGPDSRKAAMDCYRLIVDLCIPGEKYCDLAKGKLR